ncbi:MAG: MFS transporter [Alphaproteobacteria bacterium]|nr:MFS transporter [Alphaproteobacteria bacterium]
MHTQKDVDKNISLTLVEAGFSGVMANLITGVLLIKLALDLGATGVEIGLLGAFPFMCQFAQIPSVMLISYFGKRRIFGLLGSTGYRLAALGIIVSPFFFEPEQALRYIVFLSFFQHLSSGFSTGAWNGWIRALIPEKKLGSVFGNRMFYFTLTGTIAALIAAIGVDVGTAYNSEWTIPIIQICFTLGLVAGMFSFYYYASWPDVEAETAPPTTMLKEFILPLKDKSFRKLIFFLLCLLFAFNLAVPFFTVYMLQVIALPVTYVMGFWALGQFMQVPFFRWWGAVADHFSHTAALGACLPFFVISLLLWPLTTLPEPHFYTIPILILIHILIGIGLSGVILSTQVIALKIAPQAKASSYMATSTMLSSFAAGIASIAGGYFVEKLNGYSLRLNFVWATPEELTKVVAYDLRNYDFLFVGAAILILLIIPLLATIKEEGKVHPDEIRRLMRSRAMGMFRSFTTVAGLRQLTTYPISRVVERRKNHKLRAIIGGDEEL